VRHLCDINVFIAGAVELHACHDAAKAFFRGLGPRDTVEFCRATEIGFLRLLTQKIAEGFEPLSNREARAALSEWVALPYVRIAPEPAGVGSLWPRLAERDTPSPKVWMDAWLAAFAISAKMRLVTLDPGFKVYRDEGLDLLLLASNRT